MRTKNSLLQYQIDNGIVAFSTTRTGGVSEGRYASFNCTPYTGDNPEHVLQNQRILTRLLPETPREPLVIPYQTHSHNLVEIGSEYLRTTADERREMLQDTDALITREKGICLCISTADCIPVLLFDATHHAIAAIHAGWRGTVNRIVGLTLQAMHQRYGTTGGDVRAVVAPGISLAAFEVGDEVCEAFRAQGFPMQLISQWMPQSHKYHLDLPMANFLQLHDFGVPASQITMSDICTYTQYDKFFSARRMGIHSGRILSGIMMKKEYFL